MMTQQNSKSKPESLQGIENCRVIEIGIGDFVECAGWGPVTCSHSLPLGSSFICMHPQVDKIIEKTKKALIAAKP